MILTLTEPAAFARSASEAQKDAEKGMLRSARLALRRHQQDVKQWADALVEHTVRLYKARMRVEAQIGDTRAASAAVERFRKEVTAALKKTGVPTDDEIEARAKALAASLTTSAINAATEDAADLDEDPDSLVKVWFSMEDSRVRPTHAAANGQSVGVGEKFTVGGSPMDHPGDMSAPIEEWINCRCVMSLVRTEAVAAAGTPKNTTTTGADMTITLANAEPDTLPPLTDEEKVAVVEEVPWYGVLAPEDVMSGDGRKFSAGALRTRDLPLPLAWQKTNEPGHDGSVVVGRIDSIWRKDGEMRGQGIFLSSVPEADEAIGLLSEGGIRGVSIDADDGTMEMFVKDGRTLDEAMEALGEDEGIDFEDIVTVFTDARICGATLCPIPAFMQAFVSLGVPPDEFLGADVPSSGQDQEALAAAVALADPVIEAGVTSNPTTEDGPGWLTHPIDTDRLRDYWVRGEGAAKIGWGTDGDFNRCRTHLAQYVKPQYLSGYCANRHFDALGFWPGQHHSGSTLVASADVAPIRFVHTDDRPKPPVGWFTNPNLLGPSPVTVTEEGRVYGHLARWDECHIGVTGICTVAPHSMADYAYFRTGYVLTDDGPIPTGTLTMGTGHADKYASAKATVDHYDNTGLGVAYVAAGEDEWGIWVAGCVAPGTTSDQIIKMRASALSGDWREIAGNLELVAALHVNVQGFPIPHTSLAASGGRQVSLVAAGIVPPLVNVRGHSELTIEEITDRVIVEQDRRASLRRMRALAVKTGRDPASRIRAVAASVKG